MINANKLVLSIPLSPCSWMCCGFIAICLYLRNLPRHIRLQHATTVMYNTAGDDLLAANSFKFAFAVNLAWTAKSSLDRTVLRILRVALSYFLVKDAHISANLNRRVPLGSWPAAHVTADLISQTETKSWLMGWPSLYWVLGKKSSLSEGGRCDADHMSHRLVCTSMPASPICPFMFSSVK